MALANLHNGTWDQQFDFVRRIWPTLPEYAFHEAHYTRILQYADRQIEKLQRQPAAYSISSRDEVLQIIDLLQRSSALTKASIAQALMSATSSRHEILRTLDFTASLWLTARVESLPSISSNVSESSVFWDDHATLPECIAAYFNVQQDNLPEADIDRIPRGLTVAHLCHRYGFRVVWTDNLVKHLTIDWVHKEIVIYEHLIFLYNHTKYASEHPIPRDILEEAIDTINLLFPSGERETRAFLEKSKRGFFKLGYCERERCLQVSGFRFWRRDILQLVEVLDRPPAGWRQLGLDRERRNFLDWATFWLALIVAVLTITSIVFGVVSIVYSVKSYDVAVDSLRVGIAQLDLAIAQACMAPGAATDLPQFCAGNASIKDNKAH